MIGFGSREHGARLFRKTECSNGIIIILRGAVGEEGGKIQKRRMKSAKDSKQQWSSGR
jgi:hypothetical protein